MRSIIEDSVPHCDLIRREDLEALAELPGTPGVIAVENELITNKEMEILPKW